MSGTVGQMLVYWLKQDLSNWVFGGYTWDPDKGKWVETVAMLPNRLWSLTGRVGDYYYLVIWEGSDNNIIDQLFELYEGAFWFGGDNGLTGGGSDYPPDPPGEDDSSDTPPRPPLPIPDDTLPLPSDPIVLAPSIKKIFIDGVSSALSFDLYESVSILPVDLIIGNSEGAISLDEFRISMWGRYTTNFTPAISEYSTTEFSEDVYESIFSYNSVDSVQDKITVDVTSYFSTAVDFDFISNLIREETVDVEYQRFGTATVVTFEASGVDYNEVLQENTSTDAVELFWNVETIDETASTTGSTTADYTVNEAIEDIVEESVNSILLDCAEAESIQDVTEEITNSNTITDAIGYEITVVISSEPTTELPDYKIDLFITEILAIRCSVLPSIVISKTISEALGLSDISSSKLEIIISEFISFIDSQLIHSHSTQTIVDTFLLYEDIKLQFVKTINEALSLTDSPSAMLELLLSEFITFTETALPNWNTTRTVNESIALTDSVVQALQLFITESLTLTDAQVVQLQLAVVEFVSLSESAIPNWNSTRTVNDSLTLTDILYQQLNLILTEALTCTDSTPLCQLGLAIYEYLGFTELLSSPGRFSVDTTDTLDAADSLIFGYAQVISDVFSLVDATDTIRLLLNTVAEGLGLSESISASLNSVLPIAESLTLIDTVTSQGRLYNIVHDTLLLNVIVELDGEVWECYVLNTPKFLPSIYSGFNFNSYCVFQNRAYGCKSDGIYELTGDTDNGTVINTGVQLSETKFGLPNQKRFRKAYIGVSGTTPLLTMETETSETKTYSIDTDGEVDASRSLRSKKWKLTVTDFESLDFIKLVPVVLAK